MSRAIHHQKGDQAAALVGHGERDLAAKRVGLGDAGVDHFQARFMREPVSGNKIGHAAFLKLRKRRYRITKAATLCIVMPAHSRSQNGVASLAFGGHPRL
jgi:hypothetical protein